MRSWVLVIAAVVSALALTSCSKPTVVGKWTATMPLPQGPAPATFTFNPDWTFTGVTTVPTHGTQVEVTLHGRWELTYQGNTETFGMSFQWMEAKGMGLKMPADAQRTMRGPIRFSGDTFVVGDGPNADVFTRAKE